MDDFFADIDEQIERLGGGWAAYLVRALWNHQVGLDRQLVIDAVLEDALDRGRPVPPSFESTIQATFQQHNSASNVQRDRLAGAHLPRLPDRPQEEGQGRDPRQRQEWQVDLPDRAGPIACTIAR